MKLKKEVFELFEKTIDNLTDRELGMLKYLLTHTVEEAKKQITHFLKEVQLKIGFFDYTITDEGDHEGGHMYTVCHNYLPFKEVSDKQPQWFFDMQIKNGVLPFIWYCYKRGR